MPDETPSTATPPAAQRAGAAVWLLAAIVLGVAAAMAVGVAGRWWWLADLATHFRPVYALVAGVVALGFLGLRRWRWLAVAAAVFALSAASIVPLYVPRGIEPEAQTLRLMHVNVNTANRAHAAVADAIAEAAPDVLFLQEVDDRWLEALVPLLPEYAVRLQRPRSDNFGLAMLVRRDVPSFIHVSDAGFLGPDKAGTDLPVIAADVQLGGRPLRLLSVHPLPPVSRDYAAERDAQFVAISRWAAAQDVPVVVIGDLNATPWSHSFALLTGEADLLNSQRGFGIQASWPSSQRMGRPLIPIDHVLHSPQLVTADRWVGRDVGSDHRPLIIDLAWPAATAP